MADLKNFFHVLKEDAKEIIKPVRPFTVYDYIAVLAAALAAFFVFDTASVIQIAGASFGYLNRQFSNFYEYARECGIGEVCYMPAMYVVYALWNLPLKLTFLVRYPTPEAPYFVLLWYKLLLVLLYIACVYLVYKLALEIGMGIKKSKLCALAAFTMPVSFFLQFSYGQVMVFPLFFVLLGLFFLIRNNYWKFIACFSAAIAFEQFVWILFLPLLFLREKRLKQLCAGILAASVPFCLEYLPYSRNTAFLQNVAVFDIDRSLAAGLNIGIFVIQYAVFFWILVLGWAYFTSAKTKSDMAGYALFFMGLAGVLTLCVTDWKAEYFMLLAPLSVLGAFLHRDMRIFMILDIGWGGLMAAYVVWIRFDLSGIGMIASLYTVLLLVVVAFKHPSFLMEKADDLPLVCTGWLRTRFIVGALLCMVPAVAGKLFG